MEEDKLTPHELHTRAVIYSVRDMLAGAVDAIDRDLAKAEDGEVVEQKKLFSDAGLKELVTSVLKMAIKGLNHAINRDVIPIPQLPPRAPEEILRAAERMRQRNTQHTGSLN